MHITWIIGRVEAKLMSLLPEIEFLTLDKRRFLRELLRLRRALAGRRFDAVLAIHVSFRANLVCALVPATLKLGFDRARSRDGQWLITCSTASGDSRRRSGYANVGSSGTYPCLRTPWLMQSA